MRVRSIHKPASKDRGYIEVVFLGQVTFRLDDSLYVEPLLAKKLQALLESGLKYLAGWPARVWENGALAQDRRGTRSGIRFLQRKSPFHIDLSAYAFDEAVTRFGKLFVQLTALLVGVLIAYPAWPKSDFLLELLA